MKSIRQLMRQPIKALMGIFLAAGACCALCICIAQFMASKETQQQLEVLFQPVGFPSASYEKAADDWLISYAEENPDVVKQLGAAGLVSAYIPDLVPDNYTQYCPPANRSSSGYQSINLKYLPNMSRTQYTCAMLLITLEEIGEPVYQSYEYIEGSTEYGLAQTQRMIINLKGTVEEVLGLEQGYNDPVGYTADLTLCLPDQEALDKLDLVPGQKYLVFGTDYLDADYNLRCYFAVLNSDDGSPFPFIRSFDPDRLYMYTEEEIERTSSGLPESQVVVGYYEYDEGIVEITRSRAEQLRTVTLTIWDQSSMPLYTYEKDSLGQVVEVVHQERSFFSRSGEMITMDVEEYHRSYAEPTIAKIETTAEEFFESEEGALWANTLKDIEINCHAFPVIGVEEIGFIPDFFYGAARISQGREFTRQELAGGAKVCLISEKMAQTNGLSLGDSISLQTYQNDLGVPYQTDIASGNGACTPMACYYYGVSMSLNPAEDYTIVGLYQQDNAWGNYSDNLYAFTPNTIFVPLHTVAEIAEYSYTGLFRSLLLNGEHLDRFLEDMGMAGYSGQLLVDDNGYSAAAEGVANYNRIAQTAVLVSAGVFTLVLFLFLILYPGFLGKTMFTMESMGAARKARIRYVLEYTFAILLPGTLLGILAGRMAWGYVTAALQRSSGVENAVLAPAASFLLAGLMQLLLFAFFTAIVAILLSREHGMRKK